MTEVTGQASAAESPAPRPRVLTGLFVTLTGGAFLFQTSLLFLVPVLPLYLASVGSSVTTIGLVMGLGSFGALAVRLWSGRLIARYGRGTFLVGGALAVTLGAAALPLTGSAAEVLPLRLALAGAMALYMTAAATMAADLAPEARRGEAMGVFGAAAPLAMAVGPGLGGLLLAVYGFGGAFAGSASFAAAAVLAALLLRRRGAGTAAPPPRAAPPAWIAREALLPAGVMLGVILSNGALFTFAPVRAAEVGLGNAGSLFVAYAVAMMLVRPWSGRVSDRRGRALPMLPGFAAAVAGLAVMGATAGPLALLAAAALFGAGLGAVSPPLTAWVVDRVGPEQRPVGISTLLLAMDIGIGTGSVAVGVLIHIAGFEPAFLLLALLVGLVGLAFTGLWWREHHAIVVPPHPGAGADRPA